jgi:hypothetical protein
MQGHGKPDRNLPHSGIAAHAQQQTPCVSIMTAVASYSEN